MKWLIGGAIGLGIGYVLGQKTAKRPVPPSKTCPVSEVSRWMSSRGESGVLVSSRLELQEVPAGTPEIQVVVTQDRCEAFLPNADGTGWQLDQATTDELHSFLGVPAGPRQVVAVEPPISRPFPV